MQPQNLGNPNELKRVRPDSPITESNLSSNPAKKRCTIEDALRAAGFASGSNPNAAKPQPSKPVQGYAQLYHSYQPSTQTYPSNTGYNYQYNNYVSHTTYPVISNPHFNS